MKLTAKAARARAENGPAILLFAPQLGENVGQVARAMLNFGLADLRLVRPRFGWPNAKAVAAAAGAHAVLNRMRIFPGLAEATGDLHHLFATTARPRELEKPVTTAEAAAAETRRLAGEGRRVGFLFGPERSGLANAELALADAIVTIPLNPAFSSLNLAQAVLLCAYEWFKAGDRTPPRREAAGEPPATKAELAGFLAFLVTELDRSGFFRSPTRRRSLVRAIEVMFERRRPTRAELNLLWGIVKQLGGRGGTRTL